MVLLLIHLDQCFRPSPEEIEKSLDRFSFCGLYPTLLICAHATRTRSALLWWLLTSFRRGTLNAHRGSFTTAAPFKPKLKSSRIRQIILQQISRDRMLLPFIPEERSVKQNIRFIPG
jgi:hypothetical protein